MKRILILSVFIFALTVFRTAASQTAPHATSRSAVPDKAGIENLSHERRFISYDLKTVKKKERAVEGEPRMVRFERNHRIGHLFRLA